jgi:hypothetical protein
MGAWCDFDAITSDPQILLAPMMVRNGKIEISIAIAAATDARFKLYWRYDNDDFTEQSAVTLEIGRETRVLHWEHVSEELRWLHLRLDPADTVCLTRFKGYLIGDVLVFRELMEAQSSDGQDAAAAGIPM